MSFVVAVLIQPSIRQNLFSHHSPISENKCGYIGYSLLIKSISKMLNVIVLHIILCLQNPIGINTVLKTKYINTI